MKVKPKSKKIIEEFKWLFIAWDKYKDFSKT